MKKNWIVGYCVSFVICLGLTTRGLAAIDLQQQQQPSLKIGDVQFAPATPVSDVESSHSSSILSSSLVELSFRSHIKRNTAGTGNNSSSSRKDAILNAIKQNNHKIIALVDKSVTLSCSIDLDDKTFSKSQDYKIIWSRETDNGKDYEPLALDDNRLVANERITPTRTLISNSQQNRIEWSLVINNVKPSDSNNYICQLNRKPYDIYWLKRFMLSVYEPAYFVDSREMSEETTNNSDSRNAAAAAYENSVFVKSINEFQDFKLKCLAKGKPRPTVSWHLRYFNNTLIHLNIDDNEIIIKNIKRNSKIDKVECQATNGYGATAIRSFKINIKHSPHIISKPKSYNVPTKTDEVRLNCTLVANPEATVTWMLLRRESIPGSLFEHLGKNGANQTKHTQLYLDGRAPDDWVSINHMASYTVIFDNPNDVKSSQDYNKDYYKDYYDVNSTIGNFTFARMPLSKYQITDKHSGHNVISSFLVIKQIYQRDSGLYRCIASNQLGNKTLDFKITVLERDESSERQKIKNKKNPYSIERSKTFKHSNKNKSENENSRNGASSHQQDFVSESEEYLYGYGSSSSSHFMSHQYCWTIVLTCLIIPLVSYFNPRYTFY